MSIADFVQAETLARIQFAFTISFHIIFPAFTIGLASWLAMLELLYLRTNKIIYKNIYKLWVKVFAVSFGMGVVSGIVMSYAFGTNWSEFSRKTANVISPLLGYEVLTAFFLEASFLGIMLFGWERVSKKMHFISSIIVAIGTLISAFWIISANSWMHTPQGFTVDESGVFMPTSWLEIIFNPSFKFRFVHMITACYLTTAFVVTGVGSWYLVKNKFIAESKVMISMGLIIIVIFSLLQPVIGDLHGLNTLKYQPQKVAAMEGLWDTERGSGLKLFGIPDDKAEETKYAIEVPKMTSLILTHDLNGEVKGLKAWPKEERPPVLPVFFAFRIMVGIGLLMILTALSALLLIWRKKLFQSTLFQKWCILMSPSGFVAILAGWFTTEIGRQPYLVYNLLRRSDGLSPVPVEPILLSLIMFLVVYLFIFGMAIYYILHLIAKGPEPLIDTEETFGAHGAAAPAEMIEAIKKGGDSA